MLLEGKRVLVTGVLNTDSIAFSIARSFMFRVSCFDSLASTRSRSIHFNASFVGM